MKGNIFDSEKQTLHLPKKRNSYSILTEESKEKAIESIFFQKCLDSEKIFKDEDETCYYFKCKRCF
jgi:hypothetical protein